MHSAVESKLDQIANDEIVFAFLSHLARFVRDSASMVEAEAHADICRLLTIFMSQRVPELKEELEKMTSPPPPPAPQDVLEPRQVQRNQWRERLTRSRPIRIIYDLVFPKQIPTYRAHLRQVIVARLPTVWQGRLTVEPEEPRPTLASEKPEPASAAKLLAELTEGQLQALASTIASARHVSMNEGRQRAERLNRLERQTYVFASQVFPTTWTPLVKELVARGHYVAWVGIDDLTDEPGYGSLETATIPAHEKHILDFLGIAAFPSAIKRAPILLHSDSFHGSGFRADYTTALYAILTSFLAAVRSQGVTDGGITLVMYDGMKPVSHGTPNNKALSFYYKALVQAADKIIFNSNTEHLGDFIANAAPLRIPRLHFYRYTEPPKEPRARIPYAPDNVHMVCITVCLNEFYEPSHADGANYIRGMIKQGIHFHYYCRQDHPVVLKFAEDLGDYRNYFHTHPIIKDQAKLVAELQQYHVGINPTDHIVFSEGVTLFKDRFYRDGISAFLLSTVGSSFIVYAAAGLPAMIPRACIGAQTLLGQAAIPILFSELENMRDVLANCNLPERMKYAEEKKADMYIGQHVTRFVNFLGDDRLGS